MLRRNRYLKLMEEINKLSISKADLAKAMFALETDSEQGALKRMQRLYRSSGDLQHLLEVLGYEKKQKHLTIAQAVVMNALLGGDADGCIYESICAFIEQKYPNFLGR